MLPLLLSLFYSIIITIVAILRKTDAPLLQMVLLLQLLLFSFTAGFIMLTFTAAGAITISVAAPAFTTDAATDKISTSTT